MIRPNQNHGENKMEYKLYNVADAIMDSAAVEYRSLNLSSIESVQQYASSMDVGLTRAEAQLIRICSLRMADMLNSGEIPSTHDWHVLFEEPLKEV